MVIGKGQRYLSTGMTVWPLEKLIARNRLIASIYAFKWGVWHITYFWSRTLICNFPKWECVSYNSLSRKQIRNLSGYSWDGESDYYRCQYSRQCDINNWITRSPTRTTQIKSTVYPSQKRFKELKKFAQHGLRCLSKNCFQQLDRKWCFRWTSPDLQLPLKSYHSQTLKANRSIRNSIGSFFAKFQESTYVG